MADLFAVVFHRDLRLDVPGVAPAIAAALQRNIYDARHLARYARGIVAEELSREEADSLLACLSALGIESAIIRQETLPVLPVVKRVQAVDCRAHALAWKINLQQPLWGEIPWSQVVFISVGIVAAPHYRDFVTSNQFKVVPSLRRIDDPALRKELKERLASRALRRETASEIDLSARKRIDDEELKTLYREQTFAYCDLLVADPVQRLRVSRHDCHFDYLAERMKPTSLENFRLMAEDLLTAAPGTHVPDLTRAYRDGIELQRILFDSIDEFERYERWSLYRAGQPGGAPAPATPTPVDVKSTPVAEEAGPSPNELPPPTPPAPVPDAPFLGAEGNSG